MSDDESEDEDYVGFGSEDEEEVVDFDEKDGDELLDDVVEEIEGEEEEVDEDGSEYD